MAVRPKISRYSIASLVGLLASCATSSQETLSDELVKPSGTVPAGYGDIRNPIQASTPAHKDEPTVPPPASTVDPEPQPPKPKANPCRVLCQTLRDENKECADLTTSCQRLIDAGVPDAKNKDICKNKVTQCDVADAALERAEQAGCTC